MIIYTLLCGYGRHIKQVNIKEASIYQEAVGKAERWKVTENSSWREMTKERHSGEFTREIKIGWSRREPGSQKGRECVQMDYKSKCPDAKKFLRQLHLKCNGIFMRKFQSSLFFFFDVNFCIWRMRHYF